MVDISVAVPVLRPSPARPVLRAPSGALASILFFGMLGAGLLLTAWNLHGDLADAGGTSRLHFLLLLAALLIALGFEFVNGFHDTANAVATVIYTHALPAPVAVVWSGTFNFLGVLASSGAVAFGIVALLPVELILQVGSKAGFAMVFALLIAAIVWNLFTWSLGLPASSSHTLIGSIIGIGIANALLSLDGDTSGVDWSKATSIGWSLLLSPLLGFCAAGLLLLVLRRLVRDPRLYQEPHGTTPPPPWIRGLLIATCTGVSFVHGSNDGQKGMGLIMLILVGIAPTAYAVNRAMPDSAVASFRQSVAAASEVAARRAGGPALADGEARDAIEGFLSSRTPAPGVWRALDVLLADIDRQIGHHGSLRALPADLVDDMRNDMYLASEALRLLMRDGRSGLDTAELAALARARDAFDEATKYIPLWVKIAVAVALGLGTMIGWKRVVITVGEKIGKSHMSYAQGASAELIAMGTIAAADVYGLPVSTTHVLSSGVAGTMAANGSGVQMATLRNLLLAWVLTLPAAILLSGGLFMLFVSVL